MTTLMQRPTEDPRIRAYRLAGTATARSATIHEIVRRSASELDRGADFARRRQVVLPWIATR